MKKVAEMKETTKELFTIAGFIAISLALLVAMSGCDLIQPTCESLVPDYMNALLTENISRAYELSQTECRM